MTPLLVLLWGCAPSSEPHKAPAREVACTVDAPLRTHPEVHALADRGCTAIEGDLRVYASGNADWPPVSFDHLRSVSGTLEITGEEGKARFEFPDLVEVGPWLIFDWTAAVLSAPKLEALATVDTHYGTLELPQLASVDSLTAQGPISLPALDTAGAIELRYGGSLPALRRVDTLESIGQPIDLPALTYADELRVDDLTAPLLTEVTELRIFDAASGGIPGLEYADSIDIYGTGVWSFPQLKGVDDLFFSASDTGSLDVPVLANAGSVELQDAPALSFPALVGVDKLSVAGGGSPVAPVLTTVVNALELQQISGDVLFPALRTAGSIVVESDGDIAFPSLVASESLNLGLRATHAARFPELTGSTQLILQGGTLLELGPSVLLSEVWMDSFEGAVDLRLQQDALVTLGYLTTDSVTLTEAQQLASLRIEHCPALSTLSGVGVQAIGSLALWDLPNLQSLDLPSLSAITDCLGLESTALDAPSLAALDAAAALGGGESYDQAWVCP